MSYLFAKTCLSTIKSGRQDAVVEVPSGRLPQPPYYTSSGSTSVDLPVGKEVYLAPIHETVFVASSDYCLVSGFLETEFMFADLVVAAIALTTFYLGGRVVISRVFQLILDDLAKGSLVPGRPIEMVVDCCSNNDVCFPYYYRLSNTILREDSDEQNVKKFHDCFTNRWNLSDVLARSTANPQRAKYRFE